MNIIKSKTILAYGRQYSDDKESLNVWLVLLEMDRFNHFPDLRKVFPGADLEDIAPKSVWSEILNGKRHLNKTILRNFPENTMFPLLRFFRGVFNTIRIYFTILKR